MLLLDTLFPPGPDQLVADCLSVGAEGCFAYVYRPGGTGNWAASSGHIATLRADGLRSIPILVPLPAGDDPNHMIDQAVRFGFNGGPITLDLEPPNLPPAAWEEQFDAAARARGFTDFDYGTPTNLGLYQPDDAEWKATWLRTGVLNPLPPLPLPPYKGWQFVNDVLINGTEYDASVIDPSIFGGSPPKEIEMLMLHPPTGLGVLVSGDLVVQLPADGTTEALQAAGVQVVNVSQAFFDNVISAAAVIQGSVKGSLNVSGLLNVARGVGA